MVSNVWEEQVSIDGVDIACMFILQRYVISLHPLPEQNPNWVVRG